MRKLVMNFVGDEQIELFESCFIHPLVGEERRCIRGKRSGAFRGYSTFQWTRAVQALSLLVIEGALRAREPSPFPAPLLFGSSGSFASSLDYAIDKQTSWLFDMFGWNASGSSMSRRLFMRSNPGQRISGPVAISINLNFLALQEIEILLNYQPITTIEGLRHLRDRLALISEDASAAEGARGKSARSAKSSESTHAAAQTATATNTSDSPIRASSRGKAKVRSSTRRAEVVAEAA